MSVNIQIRDVSEQVRDNLAEAARSHGQSMQMYLRNLLEEESRRANNIALIQRVRAMGGGDTSDPDEIVAEIHAARAERDRRNTGLE